MASAVSRLICILTNSVKALLFLSFWSPFIVDSFPYDRHSGKMKWNLHLVLAVEDAKHLFPYIYW